MFEFCFPLKLGLSYPPMLLVTKIRNGVPLCDLQNGKLCDLRNGCWWGELVPPAMLPGPTVPWLQEPRPTLPPLGQCLGGAICARKGHRARSFMVNKRIRFLGPGKHTDILPGEATHLVDNEKELRGKDQEPDVERPGDGQEEGVLPGRPEPGVDRRQAGWVWVGWGDTRAPIHMAPVVGSHCRQLQKSGDLRKTHLHKQTQTFA